MLRHLPKYTYSGLTIIMSNPSRHDKTELLSGVAGYFFSEECLYPQINKYQTDIRLIDDKSPLLKNTKAILLLGQRAQSIWTGTTTSLDENRGSPFIANDIPCISSFAPQDCIDPVNHEKKFNFEALMGVQDEDDYESSEESHAGEIFADKSRTRTARTNYRFWLKADCKKIIRILENDGKIPKIYEGIPNYILNPPSDFLIDLLTNTKGQDLYFDMETDFISMDMRCFAFSFASRPFDIYTVPVLDINYKPAYSKLPQIFRALAIAIKNNTLVAHNGQVFDFVILAYKYGIAIGDKVYDTLRANQRIFPTLEKSLGHCVSYYTYEPYHKNEGNHSYMTSKQADELYLYCGKDVFTMYLVKKAQDELCMKDARLKSSVDAVMKAIKPFITITLTGMKYNEEARKKWVEDNDFLMTFYMKCIKILCGPMVEPLISNKKCVAYFHKQLEYPVVMKSTKTGDPSLAADALYKIKLSFPENTVIDFLIMYRQRQTETGKLQFKPYIVRN